MKKFFFLMTACCTISLGFTQKVVSGKVTDESGEGLPGVNVVIKGTTKGTITDLDGNYRQSIDNEEIILVFSFIGFDSQEVVVGTRTRIDIVLQPSFTDLEEVVVTGYGDISKRLFTGASQSLNIEDVHVKGVGDVSQMLQGRSAGVSVQSVSGTFGAGPKISIRGASSIYGDGSPLWVIDGVVQEDLVSLSVADLVSGNATTLIGSSVAGLNPNDIESFEILKDASATSLYGSRSLNGVIVITTKKGRNNQPLSVSYSGEFTTRSIPTYARTDILNSKDNISILKELESKGRLDITTVDQSQYSGVYGIMARRINTYNTNESAFEVGNFPHLRNQFLQQYERVNTNWFDVLFKQSLIQSHTISFSGGGESNQFYSSIGYYNDQGWTISDNVDRVTVNLRNTFSIKDRAKLTFTLLGSYRRQLAPGSFNRQNDDVFGTVSRDFDINPYSYSLSTSRTLRPRDGNGNLEYYTFNYAPINILNESKNNYINLKVQDFKFQTDFSLPLFKDKLTYTFTTAVRYANSSNQHNITEDSNVAGAYRSADNTIIRNANPYLYGNPEFPNRSKEVVLPNGGIYIESNNFLKNYYIRNALNFSETFNARHELDVFVGQEVRYIDRDRSGFTGYGLRYNDGLVTQSDPNIIAKLVQESGDYFNLSNTRERTVSFFTRATYGYDGKYFVSFTGNVNAANSQGLSNGKVNWTPTWTVSGKWNTKAESFLKNVNFITAANVRVSYGLTATAGTASNALPVFRNAITDRLRISDREAIIRIVELQNDDLTWEKQFETNLGFDIGVFKNRINLTFDIYKREGFDLFDFVKTSGIGGEEIKFINNANMVTKGAELSLRTQNVKTNNFEWISTVNFSVFNQEVTKIQNFPNILEATNDTGANLVGFPRNALYSLKFTGLDDKGLPTYDIPEEDKTFDVDFQETGIDIEATKNSPGGLLSFLKYEGPTEPNKSVSLQNTFRYKKWSLGIFITASGGNKIRLPVIFRNNSFSDLTAYSKDFINRWVLPGDENITNFPIIPDSRLVLEAGTSRIRRAYNAYNYSTERVADGTFVRLRTVSLSYDLNKNLLQKFGFSRFMISFLVQNPWLIYSDSKLNGVDPEFYNTGGVSQPVTKQYTLSVNIGI